MKIISSTNFKTTVTSHLQESYSVLKSLFYAYNISISISITMLQAKNIYRLLFMICQHLFCRSWIEWFKVRLFCFIDTRNFNKKVFMLHGIMLSIKDVFLPFSGTLVWSVVCRLYPSLCRYLKYLPKVRYIIVIKPSGAGFLIFQIVFLGSSTTLPYV